MLMSLPSSSSAGYRNRRSAAGLTICIRPCSSIVISASGAVSMIARSSASRSAAGTRRTASDGSMLIGPSGHPFDAGPSASRSGRLRRDQRQVPLRRARGPARLLDPPIPRLTHCRGKPRRSQARAATLLGRPADVQRRPRYQHARIRCQLPVRSTSGVASEASPRRALTRRTRTSSGAVSQRP